MVETTTKKRGNRKAKASSNSTPSKGQEDEKKPYSRHDHDLWDFAEALPMYCKWFLLVFYWCSIAHRTFTAQFLMGYLKYQNADTNEAVEFHRLKDHIHGRLDNFVDQASKAQAEPLPDTFTEPETWGGAVISYLKGAPSDVSVLQFV